MRTSAEIDIFGYVGNDPKTPSNDHPNFVTFSVSVNTKRKDKEDITTWYECQTSNENLSKIIRDRIKKGKQVRVRGIPRFEAYQDKNGNITANCKISIVLVEDLSQNNKEENGNKHFKNIEKEINYDLDDSIPF